jgi:hypothetical protein
VREWDTTFLLWNLRGRGPCLGGGLLGDLDGHGGKTPEDTVPMPFDKIVGDILHEAVGTRARKISVEGFQRLNIFTGQMSLITAFNLVSLLEGSCMVGRAGRRTAAVTMARTPIGLFPIPGSWVGGGSIIPHAE